MITRTNFGKYDLYTLSSGSFSVSVMNLGATVTNISFMGENMVLCYETPEEYISGTAYICASVGRFANRIGGASFTLDGKKYSLTANEGKNQLHSGPDGIDKRVWDAEIKGDSVCFSILSPDGDNGFPGNIRITEEFSIEDDSALKVVFSAETDAPTVFAPTVHPYFNLGGGKNVLNSELSLRADSHLAVDSGLIPTGETLPCSGCFDFSSMKKISDNFDDCFVLSDAHAATFRMGGKRMDMWTDFPAVQIYTGSSLPAPFEINEGIAIEPEFFPDGPNHELFPSTVLRPGDKFSKYVKYGFSQD